MSPEQWRCFKQQTLLMINVMTLSDINKVNSSSPNLIKVRVCVIQNANG